MSFYTKSQRDIQARFESQPLADAMEAGIVQTEIGEAHAAFIASRDFFFLSTVSGNGDPTVSFKGGDVGTVKVLDSTTIAFPAYDGNGMFLSLGNIQDTAKIGLLFIDFETPHRVRVQANAKLYQKDPMLADFPGAIGVVKAEVTSVFVNCARYIHKHTRTASSPYVPDAEGKQPYALWKRINHMQDHLPERDQGMAQKAGGLISEEDYRDALSRGES